MVNVLPTAPPKHLFHTTGGVRLVVDSNAHPGCQVTVIVPFPLFTMEMGVGVVGIEVTIGIPEPEGPPRARI